MARASSVRYLLGSARSRIAVQCSNAARLRAEPSARSHLESGGLRGVRGNRRVSKSKACGERSTDENGLLYSQFVQHTAGARVNPRARACAVRYQNCLHQSHRAPPRHTCVCVRVTVTHHESIAENYSRLETRVGIPTERMMKPEDSSLVQTSRLESSREIASPR